MFLMLFTAENNTFILADFPSSIFYFQKTMFIIKDFLCNKLELLSQTAISLINYFKIYIRLRLRTILNFCTQHYINKNKMGRKFIKLKNLLSCTFTS